LQQTKEMTLLLVKMEEHLISGVLYRLAFFVYQDGSLNDNNV